LPSLVATFQDSPATTAGYESAYHLEVESVSYD
jgi:hypothetical protein